MSRGRKFDLSNGKSIQRVDMSTLAVVSEPETIDMFRDAVALDPPKVGLPSIDVDEAESE